MTQSVTALPLMRGQPLCPERRRAPVSGQRVQFNPVDLGVGIRSDNAVTRPVGEVALSARWATGAQGQVALLLL